MDLRPLHASGWRSSWRGAPSWPSPALAATARPVFLAILAITAHQHLRGHARRARRGNASFYLTAILTIEPRLINATIWLFVATARLVIFFNIPVSDWHRAISLGFAGYLVVSVTLLNLIKYLRLGHPTRSISFFDGSAYLALCAWWAFAAWQKAEAHGSRPRLRAEIGGRPCLTSSSGWCRSRPWPCTSASSATTCAASRMPGTT